MANNLVNKKIECVDLTIETCPSSLVRTLFHLNQGKHGDILEFILCKGEQMRTITKTIKSEGHLIEKVWEDNDSFHLLVKII